MSKILVIGGAGFLGSHLIPSFLSSAHKVTVMDIIPKDQATKLGETTERIDYVWKSLVDISPSDLAGFDYVVNLSAQADVPLAISSPRWTFQENVSSSISLLEALRLCEKPPMKALFMSTESVYGHVPTEKLPILESEPLNPTDMYSASKAAMEAVCHAYFGQWGTRIAIVRCTTIFGERSRLKQAIPIFVQQALRGRPITIEGDGSQSRDFNYVQNVVNGISFALFSDHEFGIWNIGSGREVAIKDMAQEIIRLTGSSSEISFRPWRPGERSLRLAVSIRKAKEELGYAPGVSEEEGLLRTIEWFRQRLGGA